MGRGEYRVLRIQGDEGHCWLVRGNGELSSCLLQASENGGHHVSALLVAWGVESEYVLDFLIHVDFPDFLEVKFEMNNFVDGGVCLLGESLQGPIVGDMLWLKAFVRNLAVA